MPFIVEVMPDWDLLPGEPNSENWSPAMPNASSSNRLADSTFDQVQSADAFARSMQALAPFIPGLAGSISEHEIRVRVVTLEEAIDLLTGDQ